MKKLLLLLPFISLLISCNFISEKAKALPLMGSGGLTTDSVVFVKDQNHAVVNVYVDFPTAGNDILVNAIAEYIDEKLGGTYEGDLTNGQEVVNYYGQQKYEQLRTEYKQMVEDADPDFFSDMSFYMECVIRKVYENEQVVTFVTTTDDYYGGAHGMQYCTGVTFRKSDGRRFGYDMMRDVRTDPFCQVTKQGLKEYFSDAMGAESISDADLHSYLLTEDDVNYLSLPHNEPYMVEEGVQFIYQPYEIAPYAAGMPSYVVSYDKIRPYLTVAARKLIAK